MENFLQALDAAGFNDASLKAHPEKRAELAQEIVDTNAEVTGDVAKARSEARDAVTFTPVTSLDTSPPVIQQGQEVAALPALDTPKIDRAFNTRTATVVTFNNNASVILRRADVQSRAGEQKFDATFISADGREVIIKGWGGADNLRHSVGQHTTASLADVGNLAAATFKAVMPQGQVPPAALARS